MCVYEYVCISYIDWLSMYVCEYDSMSMYQYVISIVDEYVSISV